LPLCGGESHQLESCPKLPEPKKIEVFVEKFDTSGIVIAHAPGPSSHSSNTHSQAHENWVTVSPKKKVKAMIQATPKRNSLLKPQVQRELDKPVIVPQNTSVQPLNPTLVGPNGILLANPLVMHHNDVQMFATDPLDGLNLAGEEDPNLDMFLNLQNIEDVEMSTDYSKRKRKVEGEEATSNPKGL